METSRFSPARCGCSSKKRDIWVIFSDMKKEVTNALLAHQTVRKTSPAVHTIRVDAISKKWVEWRYNSVSERSEILEGAKRKYLYFSTKLPQVAVARFARLWFRFALKNHFWRLIFKKRSSLCSQNQLCIYLITRGIMSIFFNHLGNNGS